MREMSRGALGVVLVIAIALAVPACGGKGGGSGGAGGQAGIGIDGSAGSDGPLGTDADHTVTTSARFPAREVRADEAGRAQVARHHR